MSDDLQVREVLDSYAATETDAFINAFHFVDGGVWQDIEEEADRYTREDVSPAPFAALRAVLDLCDRWAERGPGSVRDHAGQDIRAAIASALNLPVKAGE